MGRPGLHFLFYLLIGSAIGCACHRPASTLPSASSLGLNQPQPVQTVDALCVPPTGWKPETLKTSDHHIHQVWLSPTGRTAYGIIYFALPFPVGPDIALWGFLREMRQSEGDAVLLDKHRDADLPGIRFVAEGGRYTIRTNLLVQGWRGWAVYAGTLREQEVQPAELDLAERARDNTLVGLSESTVAGIR